MFDDGSFSSAAKDEVLETPKLYGNPVKAHDVAEETARHGIA